MRIYRHILVLLLLPVVWMGCSSASFDAGRQVLAMADSIEAQGGICTDTGALLSAVSTFYPYRFSLRKDYARAEYHYGNALLMNGDSVRAKRAYLYSSCSCPNRYPLRKKISHRLSELHTIQAPVEKTNHWHMFLLAALAVACIVMALYLYAQHRYKDRIVSYYRSLLKESAALKQEKERMQREQQAQRERRKQSIESNLSTVKLSPDVLRTIHWSDETKLFDYMNDSFNGFVNKLTAAGLTHKQIRLCILVFIGDFSDKQMAELLFYSDKSIRTVKRKVAHKLGSTSAQLPVFLHDLALQSPLSFIS